jgi:hypothetical protein
MQSYLHKNLALKYPPLLFAKLLVLQSISKVESLLQKSHEPFIISLILVQIHKGEREQFYSQIQLLFLITSAMTLPLLMIKASLG